MIIGILTYHRSYNYGALLQAVALREVLESIGNEVFYIDYFPDYHKRVYAIIDWQSFKRITGHKKRVQYLFRGFSSLFPKLIRKHVFENFINRRVSPYCVPTNETFDCIVYGSDQIWRKQPFLNDYNPFYFGANDLKSRIHVSYAASLSSLPKTSKEAERFCMMVSRLNRISVRERSTRDFLCEYNVNNVRIDVDPSFLLSKEEWGKLIPDKVLIEGKYVLYYDLQSDSGNQAFHDDEVRDFAKRNDCKLVRLRAVASWFSARYDRHYDGPEEFVNLIRHATCIVTSSYHGVVFSLIFNRPFICSFLVNSHRATDLLEELGMRNCILDPGQKFPEKVSSIVYDSSAKLDGLVGRSYEYLSKLKMNLV